MFNLGNENGTNFPTAESTITTPTNKKSSSLANSTIQVVHPTSNLTTNMTRYVRRTFRSQPSRETPVRTEKLRIFFVIIQLQFSDINDANEN